MTNPKCQINVYTKDDVLRYILTSDVISVDTHLGLNDDIGSFNVVINNWNNIVYPYKDIAQTDYVKIWFGWDAVNTANLPDFSGPIMQIIAPNPENGYTRTLKGQGKSEILTRRIKTHKAWNIIDADVIATEVCTDLSLGTDKLAVDTTDVTFVVDAETYMDLMKKLSDYWYDAATQIKKDFYVTVDDKLFWQSRPARTSGVETITLANSKMLTYNVLHDNTQIKNNITVYGKLTVFNPKDSEIYGRKYPDTGDDWTYSAGWTDIQGTVATSADAPQIGTSCLRSHDAAGAGICEFYRTHNKVWVDGLAGYGAVEFWARRNQILSDSKIRLYCPDNANYYEITYAQPTPNGTWCFRRFSLGLNNTYDATANPSGEWIPTGSPSWDDIEGIYFYATAAGDLHFDLDGVCYNFGRWRSTASDATSQSDYGIRDLNVLDDQLTSDAQCQTRAETLLYQQKDPVTRIDFTTLGNQNIFLSDRIPLTIPAEDIVTNFYATSLEQHWKLDGWQTTVTTLGTLNTRVLPATTEKEVVLKEFKRQREIGRGLRYIQR